MFYEYLSRFRLLLILPFVGCRRSDNRVRVRDLSSSSIEFVRESGTLHVRAKMRLFRSVLSRVLHWCCWLIFPTSVGFTLRCLNFTAKPAWYRRHFIASLVSPNFVIMPPAKYTVQSYLANVYEDARTLDEYESLIRKLLFLDPAKRCVMSTCPCLHIHLCCLTVQPPPIEWASQYMPNTCPWILFEN